MVFGEEHEEGTLERALMPGQVVPLTGAGRRTVLLWKNSKDALQQRMLLPLTLGLMFEQKELLREAQLGEVVNPFLNSPATYWRRYFI